MPPAKHVIPAAYAPAPDLRPGFLGLRAENGEGELTAKHDPRFGEVHMGTEDQQFVIKQGSLPKLAYALLALHNQLGNPE